MDSPVLSINSRSVTLSSYDCQVIPEWIQPKVVQMSEVTGKKTVTFRHALGYGRLKVTIRVFNPNTSIKNIIGETTAGIRLYGTTDVEIDCNVLKALPFEAKAKYLIDERLTIVLLSEDLVANPIERVAK